MKKILLTGANGFFASRYFLYFKDKYEIIPLTHKDVDIQDESKVIQIVKNFNPDYIIHTAGIAASKTCEDNPELAYNTNVIGSVNIAKASSIVNAKMIFLSTEQVYNGNIESGPYTEDIIPAPNSVYGRNKLETEFKLKEILDDLWILRLTWLFGFPERNCRVNPNIIWNTLCAALYNKKLKVPVNEYRGMTYVYDLIKNFDKVFSLPYGIYNTGSKNDLNSYEVSSLVLKEMGLEHRIDEILIKDSDKYKEHPRDLRIDNSKIQSFGINFLDTKDAVGKCIKDFNYIL